MELRRKLERKGFQHEEVEAALDRLRELGYLDDDAFARAFVRRRSSTRGPAALASELASRGVDRAGVAAALGSVDAESQLASATRLAERLYAERPVPGYQAMLNRIGTKLLRRGFSSTVVRAACQAVLAGTPGAPEA